MIHAHTAFLFHITLSRYGEVVASRQVPNRPRRRRREALTTTSCPTNLTTRRNLSVAVDVTVFDGGSYADAAN